MKAIGEISTKLENWGLKEFRCAECLPETLDVESALAEIEKRKTCER